MVGWRIRRWSVVKNFWSREFCCVARIRRAVLPCVSVGDRSRLGKVRSFRMILVSHLEQAAIRAVCWVIGLI